MNKNRFNTLCNYIYSENQYYHRVPTELKEKTCSGQQESQKPIQPTTNIKLNAGNNIKLSKQADNSITIDVELKNTYKEKYSGGEYILRAGSDLDDVASILLKSVNENADAIDGEKINI